MVFHPWIASLLFSYSGIKSIFHGGHVFVTTIPRVRVKCMFMCLGHNLMCMIRMMLSRHNYVSCHFPHTARYAACARNVPSCSSLTMCHPWISLSSHSCVHLPVLFSYSPFRSLQKRYGKRWKAKL